MFTVSGDPMDVAVWSHYFQSIDVQRFSDYVGGTSGLCRSAFSLKKKKNIMVNSVMYMAEDVLVLAPEGTRVFLPVALFNRNDVKRIYRPRCPMIVSQNGSVTVEMDVIKKAVAKYPVPSGVYINTPITIKAMEEISFAYNASKGIDIVKDFKKEYDIINLFGDENVNSYIAWQTGMKVNSFPHGCVCPTHVAIPPEDVIFLYEELIEQHGESKVGVILHTEVSPALRDWGMEIGAVIGDSSYMYECIQDGKESVWIVATERGLYEKIAADFTDKVFHYAGKACPNMKFITVRKIKEALHHLKQDRIAGTCYISSDGYEVELNGVDLVKKTGDMETVSPLEIVIDEDVRERARNTLKYLVE